MERCVSMSACSSRISLLPYQLDTNKPYESSQINTILSVLFFWGSAASNINFDPFLPEHGGQKCISNAMVAFAAAAVCEGSNGLTDLLRLFSVVCMLQSGIQAWH